MTDLDAPLHSEGIIDYGRTRSKTIQLRRQWRVEPSTSPVGVEPSTSPVGVIVLVHGISEHSGRYEHIGAHFAAAGFHTVAFDHRGHGASEGPRTYIESFDQFLDDVEDHVSTARRTGLPVVLIGHSMGGLICTSYAVSDRPQPDLMVLSGPALDANVPRWQRVLAPKLAQLAPKFFLPQPDFDVAVLSRDLSVQQAYLDDPLIRSGGTTQLGAEMLAEMERLPRELGKIRIPVLVLHGADDQLVPASASVPLANIDGVERRELVGLRHEIFNEPEGPEILDDVLAWIRAQGIGSL